MFGMLALIALAQLTLVSALSIDIDMKESFDIGEEILFDYTIVSDSSQEIKYIPSVNCPTSPLPLLLIKTARLEANVPLTRTYTYMSAVSDNIEPQTCTAIIGIINYEEIAEKKQFFINTNPSFEFRTLACKDINCNEETLTFVKNEDIYLDYTSEVEEPLIKAMLTHPQGFDEEIFLPTLIEARQIGTYTLEVNASKQDYKTINKKIQFGVIRKEAKIDYISVKDISACNNNGACNYGENYFNCPDDCSSGREDNYCDKAKDGKCDKDCMSGEDPDCEREEAVSQEIEEAKETLKEERKPLEGSVLSFIIPIIAIILIIISIVYFKFFKRKKK